MKLCLAAILALGLAAPATAGEFGTAAEESSARKMLSDAFTTEGTLRLFTLDLERRVRVLESEVAKMQHDVEGNREQNVRYTHRADSRLRLHHRARHRRGARQ
jgi:TolA-binding protein